jgi:protein-S-isoprenylcysteine O-methyltransferase Ste14
MNENQPSWREKYRVRIGFVFGILFLWRAQPKNIILLGIGLLISLTGILLRQWAAGCVKKMDELATKGPYALVRHPLYVGSFVAAFGMVLSASYFSVSLSKPYLDRTLFFWTFFFLLIDAIYMPKALKEEEELGTKFQGQYGTYAQEVPRFIPKNLNPLRFDFSSFDVQIWKRNEEYWSLVGYAVLALVLIGRYVYGR